MLFACRRFGSTRNFDSKIKKRKPFTEVIVVNRNR
jgi:hypothetical protein